MFLLSDCRSFYSSCEEVFRPDLRGAPIIVLSNQDGAVVARSKAAKVLGVPAMEPFFKVRHLVEKHGIHVFSSNFPLYGSLSQNVMDTLRTFSPHIEVYSIDESFLCLSGLPNQGKEFGQRLRQTVWQHVRIPVEVGIAPSKTLAKAASKAAKSIPALDGVCVLDQPQKWEWLLRRMPVTDVWGIAKRMGARLSELNIRTAWDLATANPKIVRRRTSVNIERTIAELNGRACLEIEEVPPAKKQIYCTRSFAQPLDTLEPIQQAVTLYATRAVEKLRQQNGLVLAIHLFIHTSPFKPGYHSASKMVGLPYPTDDIRVVVRAARQALEAMYTEGHAFTKAGIGLVDIRDRRHHQLDLLCGGQGERSDRLMAVLDAVNQRHGRGTVRLAAQGENPGWNMKRQYLSPAYTTAWRDIPKVKA